MGMELHKEVGEEACRTHRDEGYTRRASPKEVSQPGQKYRGKIVCDNEGKAGEVRWIRGKDIRNVTSVRASVDAIV